MKQESSQLNNQFVENKDGLTSTKKRKFNQISQSSHQVESLNLDRKLTKLSINQQLDPNGVPSDSEYYHVSKKRKIADYESDSQHGMVNSILKSKRDLSKDKAPFQMISNKNMMNALITTNNLTGSKKINDISQEKNQFFKAQSFKHQNSDIQMKNGPLLERNMNPFQTSTTETQQKTLNDNHLTNKRLSKISERSTDHASSNDKAKRITGFIHDKMASEHIYYGTPDLSLNFLTEEFSDIAQLGTPEQLDNFMKCSQSPIRIADNFSEMSSCDLFQIGLNASNQRKSNQQSSSHHKQSKRESLQNTILLSPLHESQFVEDPLNQAMIDGKATPGKQWTKKKGECIEEMLGQLFKRQRQRNFLNNSF